MVCYYNRSAIADVAMFCKLAVMLTLLWLQLIIMLMLISSQSCFNIIFMEVICICTYVVSSRGVGTLRLSTSEGHSNLPGDICLEETIFYGVTSGACRSLWFPAAYVCLQPCDYVF